MTKKLLAAIDDRLLYRARKIQAICYASLIANAMFIACSLYILYKLIGG